MSLKFLRRGVAVAVLTIACLSASTVVAHGATLANAGGTLTFTGTDAVNDVEFDPTATPGTVRVSRNLPDDPAAPGPRDDSDPITDPAEGCTTVTAGAVYDCPGVTRLVIGVAGGADSVSVDVVGIPSTVNAGAGDDTVLGGTVADTLNGEAGADFLFGAEGDDVLDGGDGDDDLRGSDGNDGLLGGAGDDAFFGSAGNDDYRGGPGFDTANAIRGFAFPRANTTVTLDDQANDALSGATGEADNVHLDVEELVGEQFTGAGGNDTFTGSAAPDSLVGRSGNDTLDGREGNDVLRGGEGDDTIRARDGFADLVVCGPGTDTAEVDTLDRVEDCETVQRADVGNANDVPEDRPPTVAFTSPGSGAVLPNRGPAVLTADARDDRGIAEVRFIDDEQTICTDTTAPYTCSYRARGEDVGRNTLSVVAVDTAQQTASAFRAVTVDRFGGARLTAIVTPARDRAAPYRFVSRGRLTLPTGVTRAQGCREGVVSIQVKAAGKTISTRRARITRACTFRSTVSFADRRRFTRNGRLKFTARFTGNAVLKRTAAVVRDVRTR